MTVSMQRVNEVYGRLVSILHRPEVFGLGIPIPQSLSEAIEGMLLTLGQVNSEQEQPTVEGNLEEELSQDADQPSLTLN